MTGNINDKARAFANAVAKINTKKLLLQAVKNTSSLALDLNRSQLYDYGVDSKNAKIGDYSPFTVRIKQKKGQRSDHITLSDTFSFYKKMFVDAKQFPIMIDSKDTKTSMLEEKYGSDILGLTPSNLEEYKVAVTLEYKKLLHEEIEKKKELLQ